MIEYDKLSQQDLTKILIEYIEELKKLQNEISENIYTNKREIKLLITEKYKNLKYEIKGVAHYVDLHPYNNNDLYTAFFVPSISEASACGFRAKVNTSNMKKIFNSVEEAEYRMGKYILDLKYHDNLLEKILNGSAEFKGGKIMVKRELKLFFDMDETIVNLTESIIREFNKDYKCNYDYKQNRSYWWGDTLAPRTYYEKLLQQEDIFLRAKPIDGMVEMMKKLHDEGFEIHIITYPTRDSRFCSYEKYEWIRKYLPWLDTQKYLHCTGNKKLMTNWDRVLIDDSIDYLESWRLNNGISICYGDYGWNEDYKGFKVLNSIDLYDLIWTIEKGIIK